MPITIFDLDDGTVGVDAQAIYPEQQANFTPLQQVLVELQGGDTNRVDQITLQISGVSTTESLR